MSNLSVKIINGRFVVNSAHIVFEHGDCVGIMFDCKSKRPDAAMIGTGFEESCHNGFGFAVFPCEDSKYLNESSSAATEVEISGLPFKTGSGESAHIFDTGPVHDLFGDLEDRRHAEEILFKGV